MMGGITMNRVLAIQSGEIYNKNNIRTNYQKLIHEFNNLLGIINPGDKVLIKPNLVAPSEMATTDSYLLECVISTVLEIGAKPIVAESSGFEFSTEKTFEILGIDSLCKKYDIPLINLDVEEFIEVESGNPYVPKYKLPKLISEVDKIINMPCLKGHSITKVTFSIKNLFGLLHRESRRKIHATNLEMGIRCLKKLVHVDFIIVDGLWNLTNAVFSDYFYQGIVLAGNDMTAVDICCCRLFGVDYKSIPHIYAPDEQNGFSYVELSEIVHYDNKIKERSKHFSRQSKKYKIMYSVDLLFYSICKFSFIPYAHYFLGLRPYVNKKKCKKCGLCEKICPVNAINGQKISIKKCFNVRCLRCLDACPYHAIEKRGFHKQ